jgi:hypothetical protein
MGVNHSASKFAYGTPLSESNLRNRIFSHQDTEAPRNTIKTKMFTWCLGALVANLVLEAGSKIKLSGPRGTEKLKYAS